MPPTSLRYAPGPLLDIPRAKLEWSLVLLEAVVTRLLPATTARLAVNGIVAQQLLHTSHTHRPNQLQVSLAVQLASRRARLLPQTEILDIGRARTRDLELVSIVERQAPRLRKKGRYFRYLLGLHYDLVTPRLQPPHKLARESVVLNDPAVLGGVPNGVGRPEVNSHPGRLRVRTHDLRNNSVRKRHARTPDLGSQDYHHKGDPSGFALKY